MKLLLFRRLFDSRSEQTDIFKLMLRCVPRSNVDILTFSSQFTASHYGIRRNLRATGVSTVYDVKMATKISTEEKFSASQPGLSHDDIREEDSLPNVTSTTSRGSHSSLAKTRAKKAALLAQQNDKRNTFF